MSISTITKKSKQKRHVREMGSRFLEQIGGSENLCNTISAKIRIHFPLFMSKGVFSIWVKDSKDKQTNKNKPSKESTVTCTPLSYNYNVRQMYPVM